jgi:cullin-4
MTIQYFYLFPDQACEAIDRTYFSHLQKMFTALEKPFLECTSEFYAREGVKYMQQYDIPD